MAQAKRMRPKPKNTALRVRTKDPVVSSGFQHNIYGWRNDFPNFNTMTETLTDRRVRPCELRRVTQGVRDIFATSKDGDWFTTYNSVPWFVIDPEVTTYLWAPFEYRLNVKKLATSNQADLFINIAEAKDTAKMLGSNLSKSASYGGYKWGWMPLIQDVLAVNDAHNAVKNSFLEGNRRSHQYSDSYSFTVKSGKILTSTYSVVHTWEITVKLSGTIQYENDVLAFYDYMGFHPSPKILWDLVPLSFAVDYILPIGDMLRNVTPPKGWVKSANFTGWRVLKAKVTEECTLLDNHPNLRSIAIGNVVRSHVSRDYLSGAALEQRNIPKPIEAIKMPTLEQICDLSYLAETFYRTGKRLMSPHVYRKRR